MFRNFFLPLTVISLAAWCAVTIACGSSNKSTSCTGGPYNVVGDWQVSVQSGSQSVTGYGAIDSAGLALFFDNSASTGNSGDTLELPTVTGSCAFSGNITDYEEPGGLSSGQSTTDSVQGNVTSATALNGTFTGSNGSGTFTAATFSPLTGSVSAVTGSKTGVVQGTVNSQSVLLPLTFSATGTGDSMSFTSSISQNCNAAGTFTQVGTANVFDVSITFTSTGGIGCALPGTFTGIGFESNSDYFNINGNNPADTYLNADILASSNTFVMEIF
jgi:hypothetical protein